MSKFFVICALFFLLLVSQIEAHHSVRFQKPATEELREAFHIHHRSQRKPKHKPDAPEPHPNDPEVSKRLHKSPSYHFQYGPEYPHHTHMQDYKPKERFNYRGQRVPDFMSDEQLRHHN